MPVQVVAGKMSAAMDAVTAFAPATVSNVACGFDVLGFALHAPGDPIIPVTNILGIEDPAGRG